MVRSRSGSRRYRKWQSASVPGHSKSWLHARVAATSLIASKADVLASGSQTREASDDGSASFPWVHFGAVLRPAVFDARRRDRIAGHDRLPFGDGGRTEYNFVIEWRTDHAAIVLRLSEGAWSRGARSA